MDATESIRDELASTEFPLSDEIWNKTRSRIRGYFNSRGDWSVHRALKNLTEQAVRDYEHRSLIELIQNAHDAHEKGDRDGRVFIRLDSSRGKFGEILIANTGRPFSRSNFDAITDVAASDKKPDEGIGNKGIGFKSILQLTNGPQIYSVSETPRNSLDQLQWGYCFGFAGLSDVERVIESNDASAAEVMRDVLHLCLPVPALNPPSEVQELLADGFVTTVVIPLKSDEARRDAEMQIAELNSQPPALLFLKRIRLLTTSIDRKTEHHRRLESKSQSVGDVIATEVDLERAGKYLLLERTVPAASMKEAIHQSVADDHLSAGWSDWQDDAIVSVALRIDQDLKSGRMYTYLPLGEGGTSPLRAHINAPFFAKLARVDLERSVPLNDFLIDEVARLCASVLLRQKHFGTSLTASHVVDLLTWELPFHSRLVSGFKHFGTSIADVPIVPLTDGSTGLGRLSNCWVWNHPDFKVLTSSMLRTVAKLEVVADLNVDRLQRLERCADSFVNRSLVPSSNELAAWSESVASRLETRPFDAETWALFYDELSVVVTDVSTLVGRRILVDQKHNLRRTNEQGSGRRVSTAFFAPSLDDDEEDAELEPPVRLVRRVVFVTGEIPWLIRRGSTRVHRRGWDMLSKGLVREYRASDLLPVIARPLKETQDEGLIEEIFHWTHLFARGRNDPPWSDIRKMDLLVPAKDGRWIPASSAIFAEGWNTTAGGWLNDLLNHAGEGHAPNLATISSRVIANPDDSRFRGAAVDALRTFLTNIGVTDGLPPKFLASSIVRATGLQMERFQWTAPELLDSAGATEWISDIRTYPPDRFLLKENWNRLRPETPYVSRTNLALLPGQDEFRSFTTEMKRSFARLVLNGLATWAPTAWSISVNRYNDENDKFELATPLVSFLRSQSWLGITEPGDRREWKFSRPSDAWNHEGDAPTFAPALPPELRRLIENNPLVAKRMSVLGLRNWDDPSTAPSRLRFLGGIVESGNVPDNTVQRVKKACREVWRDLAGRPIVSGRAETDIPVVVTRSNRLGVLRLNESSDPLYVNDVADRQKMSLLNNADVPVLVADPDPSLHIKAVLGAQSDAHIRLTSEARTTVELDGVEFTPSASLPHLIQVDSGWLLDLIAVVWETRASSILNRDQRFLKDRASQLRNVRYIEVDTIVMKVDGNSLTTNRATQRSAVLHDPTFPTVAVSRQETARHSLFQVAVPKALELVGMGEISDALALRIQDLEHNGFGTESIPTEEDMAVAMDLEINVFREMAAEISHGDEDRLLLMTLVTAIDKGAASTMEAEQSSNDDLMAWLTNNDSIRANSTDLHSTINNSDLDRARLLLGIPLRQINWALLELGQSPLRASADIELQFESYVSRNRDRIESAIREAHRDSYENLRSLEQYLIDLSLDGLAPNPEWVEDYLDVPVSALKLQVDDWLRSRGASPDLSAEVEPTRVEIQSLNRSSFLTFVVEARYVIRAWEIKRGEPLSELPGDPIDLVERYIASGRFDFEAMTDEQLVSLLKSDDLWPESLAPTLQPPVAQVTAEEIESAKRAELVAQVAADRARKEVQIGHTTVVAEEQNYADIVDLVRGDLKGRSWTTDDQGLVPVTKGGGRKRGQKGRTFTAGRSNRTTNAQKAVVGLSGEVIAFDWLKSKYEGVNDSCWVSGYRNQVLADGKGSDALGYDFEVITPSKRLLFEVKASSGEHAEFELGPSEVFCAQNLHRNEQYFVLFVTNALDPMSSDVFLLPNPLRPSNARFFRLLGQGLKYQFELPVLPE